MTTHRGLAVTVYDVRLSLQAQSGARVAKRLRVHMWDHRRRLKSPWHKASSNLAVVYAAICALLAEENGKRNYRLEVARRPASQAASNGRSFSIIRSGSSNPGQVIGSSVCPCCGTTATQIPTRSLVLTRCEAPNRPLVSEEHSSTVFEDCVVE
jgi:hypothetical protein